MFNWCSSLRSKRVEAVAVGGLAACAVQSVRAVAAAMAERRRKFFMAVCRTLAARGRINPGNGGGENSAEQVVGAGEHLAGKAHSAFSDFRCAR